MNLKWTEYSETGEALVKESFSVNMENVSQYARKSCSQCYARGYLEIDSGSRWITEKVEASFPMCDANGIIVPGTESYLKQRKICFNQRVITCGCVDNHFAKIEKLKDQK